MKTQKYDSVNQFRRINTIFIFIILTVTFFGCEWVKVPIVRPAQEPPFAIYKTKGDYFDYVNANFGNENEPKYYLQTDEHEATKYYHLEDSGYHLRVALDNGYVLAGETTADDYFTDLSYRDYLGYYNQRYSEGLSFNLDSIFYAHVIDEDPFLEFYSIEAREVWGYSSYEDYSELNRSEHTFRRLLRAAEAINRVINSDSLDQIYRRIK